MGFDELSSPQFPGETIAFKEEIGPNRYAIWGVRLGIVMQATS